MLNILANSDVLADQENQFLRITHMGEILRSMRLTVKVSYPLLEYLVVLLPALVYVGYYG